MVCCNVLLSFPEQQKSCTYTTPLNLQRLLIFNTALKLKDISDLFKKHALLFHTHLLQWSRDACAYDPRISCQRNKCGNTNSIQGFSATSSAKNIGEDKCLSETETFIRKIYLFLSALFEQSVSVSKSPLNWNTYIFKFCSDPVLLGLIQIPLIAAERFLSISVDFVYALR